MLGWRPRRMSLSQVLVKGGCRLFRRRSQRRPYLLLLLTKLKPPLLLSLSRNLLLIRKDVGVETKGRRKLVPRFERTLAQSWRELMTSLLLTSRRKSQEYLHMRWWIVASTSSSRYFLVNPIFASKVMLSFSWYLWLPGVGWDDPHYFWVFDPWGEGGYGRF